MKKYLIIAVLILLCSSLYIYTTKNSIDLGNALSKVPLPPGITQFEIDGDDFDRSFFITAKSSTISEEDVIAFYESYFAENGWVNDFSADEDTDGLLMYSKGRETINVTIIEIGGPLQLMVIYTLLDHTREEFDTLIKESAAPDAQKLVTTILHTYAGLKAYTDTGTLEETDDDSDLSTHATFKTAYLAPDHLRFSYSESPDDFFPTAYELAMQGEMVTKMANFDKKPEIGTDVSLAISALYGVTGTTSGNIPGLLFQEENTLFQLINLTLMEETTLGDTVCLRLRGTDFNSDVTTIWVGKADHLIRRIDSKPDTENGSSITYKPEVNIEIPADVFEFTPPITP